MRATPALALALALAPLVQAAVGMPPLAVGDAWEERTTQDGADVSTQRTTVEAREAADGHDAWRVVSRIAFTPRDAPGMTGITSGVSTLWVRVEDGALVRQTLESTFGSQQAPPAEYRWDPPCAQRRWPLDVGASWEVNCTSVSSDGQRYQGADRHEVVREEDVEVPAGAFRALVVETRDAEGALTAREWIAGGACAPVRAESVQPDGAPPVVRELTAQSCAAVAKDAPGFGVAAVLAAVLLAARGTRRSDASALPKR